MSTNEIKNEITNETKKEKKVITKEIIEELAGIIYNKLEDLEMADALCIYYNNKRINTYGGKKVIEENICPLDYCEYACKHHIMTISSEGFLYDYYDLHYEFPEEIEKLLDFYGLYIECNESWNWSVCSALDEDELEIEYTIYEKPEPMHIFLGCRERMNKEYPVELDTVMKLWYDLGQTVGDIGSCVIGEKMKFTYKGEPYEMTPITGFQGEYSFSKFVPVIEDVLRNLGATDISWDCGILD